VISQSVGEARLSLSLSLSLCLSRAREEIRFGFAMEWYMIAAAAVGS